MGFSCSECTQLNFSQCTIASLCSWNLNSFVFKNIICFCGNVVGKKARLFWNIGGASQLIINKGKNFTFIRSERIFELIPFFQSHRKRFFFEQTSGFWVSLPYLFSEKVETAVWIKYMPIKKHYWKNIWCFQNDQYLSSWLALK